MEAFFFFPNLFCAGVQLSKGKKSTFIPCYILNVTCNFSQKENNKQSCRWCCRAPKPHLPKAVCLPEATGETIPDNWKYLCLHLLCFPTLYSQAGFAVLENRLELPFATHCRNTAQDSCIFPQLTLAESYISLRVQWPPTPPTNISIPPKAHNLLAGRHQPPKPACASILVLKKQLATDQTLKKTVLWVPLDDEAGRGLPSFPPSYMPFLSTADSHPQMNTVLREVKLTLEQAEQTHARDLTHLAYLPLQKEILLLTGM